MTEKVRRKGGQSSTRKRCLLWAREGAARSSAQFEATALRFRGPKSVRLCLQHRFRCEGPRSEATA